MNSHRLRLRLQLRAPFLFKSGQSLPLGLDAATLENQQGQALIPGTHLRGHLRHALEEFAHHGALPANWIDTWFGHESPGDSGDAPARGRLDFDAYWTATIAGATGLPREQWFSLPSASFSAQSATRYRVRIDDSTGTADPGALQLIGQTHAAGTVVTFEGYIGADGATEAELKDVEHWLHKALAWIPALGALKGIGFGQVHQVELKREPVALAELRLPERVDGALALSFQLDRPYCFGARALESNRFESVPYVPGGALRGALFEWCQRVVAGTQDAKDASLILQHAQQLHIRHAWASGETRTPAVIPESAVYVDDALVDASVAPWNQPFIVKRGQHAKVPAFPVDWKSEWGRFAEAHGHLNPPTWTEVRTAIDPERLSAAENKLFSYDARLASDGKAPYTFRTEIRLDGAPADELWAALARVLPRALKRLGKTEARAIGISLAAAPAPEPVPETGRVVLCLQSDALLGQRAFGPMADEHALRQAYREYFLQHSEQALDLVDLYINQKLAGGAYFRNRYWRHEPAYRARLLTKAGSVFVFEPKTEAATATLRRWLDYGLPPAEAEDWRQNPYLRANGYGEVRLGTGIQFQAPPQELVEWVIEASAASREITP